MSKELLIKLLHDKHKHLHILRNTEVLANQMGVVKLKHFSVWGMVYGLDRLRGDTNRRLNQVRDTELFICTAVCTVKNRNVSLYVYDDKHHARCLVLDTS